ncbi:MAG: alpha/beta hydrolase [Burkholderiales bacterium PBB3]|nr:MAG: alpha/beta hydrolase [Burkholderiales bacterium PBB3]
MADPKLNYVQCPDASGSHRMAYWEWGDVAAGHVIVCAHGLSRQGRDFDVLAQALVEKAGGKVRVVCPDVVGRGQSDWLKDPALYQVPTYAADMLAMLAQLKPTTLDWLGTSMGGLIGIGVCNALAAAAAQRAAAATDSGAAQSAPAVVVRKLVLNDVGPVIQWESIVRIGTYLGRNMAFDSLQAAADAMWAISTSFGPHTPAQWLELSSHMVKPRSDGQPGVRLHYDPDIAVGVRAVTAEGAAQGEAMLWYLYDAISAPTLLLRGADSDLLAPATALQMTQRGPKAQLVEFAGVGHAPTLIAADQVDAVASFLLP